MFTNTTNGMQRLVATMAAVFVVTFAGLAIEHGHGGALPQGVVEVGELTPINLEQLAIASLPGIEVVGHRTLLAAAPAAPRERSPG